LACHPRLVDDGSTVPSAKLEAFLELWRELSAAGHRPLVFSQFTSHLALVRQELDRLGVTYAYLDGQTPSAERQRQVASFQAGVGELFLLSLKAGGTGINLTAADVVVHLDPWWNPAAEDQATDRAHRIGQLRPVTVVRLVVRETIEEAVLALHHEKRALAESLLEGGELSGTLSKDELRALVRAGKAESRRRDDT
jgi:SNF2 family DNA or RNA helicase